MGTGRERFTSMLRHVARFSVLYIALPASPCNMDATRSGLLPSRNDMRFIDPERPTTASPLDLSRCWRRGRCRLWRRCFRVSGDLFEAHDLRGRNADQRSDPKACQLPLIDQFADHAVAASPAVGQLGDRVWPHIMLGKDAATFSQMHGPFFGWHASQARRRAASTSGSGCGRGYRAR